MISVALCTFNGESFLATQLESILSQDLLPDEIIIGDDGSTDGTLSILDDYKAKFESLGISTSILPNTGASNLVNNFERTLRATNGDYIFLSDQDDVWCKNRISDSISLFHQNPARLIVHGDAQLIDQFGRQSGKSLFDALEYSRSLQDRANTGMAFELLIQRNLVTGATAAIKRELLLESLPFSPYWLHDEWLAIIAAGKLGYFVTNEDFIQYRLHANNSVGLSSRSLRSLMAFFFASRSGRYSQLVSRFSDLYSRAQKSGFGSQETIAISKAIEFNETRNLFSKRRLARIPKIAREAVNGNYKRFCFKPYREMLRDFLQSA